MKKKLKKAIRLFKEFSGHNPRFVDNYEKPEFPDVALLIGDCTGIMYETIRDGRKERYIHEFKGRSRPKLIASHTGKNLYLLGGRYKFESDGINDK